VQRYFKHPSNDYSVLVFFLGFGIEGWPDTIHGGIITTLLGDAIRQHFNNQYPDMMYTEPHRISIDFKKPVRPGQIYAVLVPPSIQQPVREDVPIDAPSRMKRFEQVALFIAMEFAPHVSSVADPITKTVKHTVEIPSSHPQDATHAIATANVILHPFPDESGKVDLSDPRKDPSKGP